VWRRIAPALHAEGVLTPANSDLLAVYCDLLVQLDRARLTLDVGVLIKGRRDGLITNPAWRIYRDAAVLVKAYATELGLTPIAGRRTRAGSRVVPALPPAQP